MISEAVANRASDIHVEPWEKEVVVRYRIDGLTQEKLRLDQQANRNSNAAREALTNAAKFAPIGKRSVCGGYPHFDYAAVPLTQSVPALNDAALVVCMIETVEGLRNVEIAEALAIPRFTQAVGPEEMQIPSVRAVGGSGTGERRRV